MPDWLYDWIKQHAVVLGVVIGALALIATILGLSRKKPSHSQDTIVNQPKDSPIFLGGTQHIGEINCGIKAEHLTEILSKVKAGDRNALIELAKQRRNTLILESICETPSPYSVVVQWRRNTVRCNVFLNAL